VADEAVADEAAADEAVADEAVADEAATPDAAAAAPDEAVAAGTSKTRRGKKRRAAAESVDVEGALPALDGEEQQPEVPMRLVLTLEETARLIGRGGASIKHARKRSKCTIEVEEQVELPTERVVSVLGQPGAQEKALRFIFARVREYTSLASAEDAVRAIERGEPDGDEPVGVAVLVPELATRHIVGSKGERIRALTLATKAQITVAKDAVKAYGSFRRVEVKGTVSSCILGLRGVHEILRELADQYLRPADFTLPITSAAGAAARVSHTFLVSASEAAHVVGKNGAKVQQLRADLSLQIEVGSAKAENFGDDDRLITVQGPAAAVSAAVAKVIADLAYASRKSAENGVRVLVPRAAYGAVIGRGGTAIRALERATGATITKDAAAAADAPMRCFTIRGTTTAMTAAAREVWQIADVRIEDVTVTMVLALSEEQLAVLLGSKKDGAVLNRIGKRTKCDIVLGDKLTPKEGRPYHQLKLIGSPQSNAEAFIAIQYYLVEH